MTVGAQASSSSMDQTLTGLAVQLRKVMQAITDVSLSVNGQGAGQAYLEGIGYDAGDATTALNMLSYLNTVAAVYYGNAAQGSAFDFNQELSQIWATQ